MNQSQKAVTRTTGGRERGKSIECRRAEAQGREERITLHESTPAGRTQTLDVKGFALYSMYVCMFVCLYVCMFHSATTIDFGEQWERVYAGGLCRSVTGSIRADSHLICHDLPSIYE